MTFEYRKSKYCKNVSPVYVSDYMSGKMEGVPSISTNCLENPICLARMQNNESVCAHCFAAITESRYKDLREHTTYNYHLLTTELIPRELLPRFNFTVSMVRIESFGDLANELQALNYLNIIAANPHVHFGWWTKNPWFIADALKQFGKKPDNVQIVFSESKLNGSGEFPEEYDFIDKTFTVYDKEYEAEHGIKINCGGNACASCGTCYFDKFTQYIREELK